MSILKRIGERLIVCWHVLTKRNYVLFAIDKKAIVFDSEGNYSHLNGRKLAQFDDFEEIKYNGIDGMFSLEWLIWATIEQFAEERKLISLDCDEKECTPEHGSES